MDEQIASESLLITSSCFFLQPALLISSELISLFMLALGCWRSTEAAADKAVEDSRQARRENGETIADGAAWTPAEYVVATAARMPLVKGAILAFKTGIMKLNKLI